MKDISQLISVDVQNLYHVVINESILIDDGI